MTCRNVHATFALVLLASTVLPWEGAAGPAPQAAAPVATATLGRAEQEEFLRRARVVKVKGVRKGITGTVRATLSDGTLTHDASIQTIDESKREFKSATGGTEFNFRDTWRFNLAAYALDKLLALDMIPATVARDFRGQEASYTWWVDDVLMDEGERQKRKVAPPDPRTWNEQMWIVRVFDQLIYNTDRNLGNVVITSTWQIWMIDHTRAFRWQKTLRTPENLTKCDRKLLERLRALDAPTIERAVDDHLGPREIEALLARRDAIVARFEAMGEQALYDAARMR